MIALLLACAPASRPDDTSPPIEEELAPSVPDWTVEQAGAAAQAALDEGLPDPRTVRDAWRELMALGDTSCPGEDMAAANIEGCTASSGTTFSGLAFENDLSAGGEESWMFTADCTIETAEGRRFVGGGNANVWAKAVDGQREFAGDVRGTWTDTDGPTWLADGASAILRVEGTTSADRTVVALEGRSAGGETAFEWAIQADTDRCDGHPSGTAALRDPSGGWFELDFADRCDGCADATWAGEPVGAVCFDARDALVDLAGQL